MPVSPTHPGCSRFLTGAPCTQTVLQAWQGKAENVAAVTTGFAETREIERRCPNAVNICPRWNRRADGYAAASQAVSTA